MNLPECAYISITVDEMTALDKVFISLRVIETANNRPDGGDRCIYNLDDSGAALVRSNATSMVARNIIRNRRSIPNERNPPYDGGWRVLVARESGGCGGGSLELQGSCSRHN